MIVDGLLTAAMADFFAEGSAGFIMSASDGS